MRLNGGTCLFFERRVEIVYAHLRRFTGLRGEVPLVQVFIAQFVSALSAALGALR